MGESMDFRAFEKSYTTKVAETALLSKTRTPTVGSFTSIFFHSDTDKFDTRDTPEMPKKDHRAHPLYSNPTAYQDRNPDDHPDWLLVDRFKAGDRTAGGELLKKHMGLIVRIAKRYRSLGLDDATQEACIGFLHGIGKCERGMGAIPSTYALHWARSKVSRARIIGGLIKIPANAQKEEGVPRYAISLDSPSPTARIAEDSSRDGAVGGSGIGSQAPGTILSRTPDEGPTAEEQLCANNRKILNTIPLNPRERFIVVKRFGYDEDSDDEGETLEKIGEALDLTKERVRQILEKILIRYRAKVKRD